MADNNAVTKEDLQNAINGAVIELTRLMKETVVATETKIMAEMDRRFGEFRNEINSRFEASDRKADKRFKLTNRKIDKLRTEMTDQFHEVYGHIKRQIKETYEKYNYTPPPLPKTRKEINTELRKYYPPEFFQMTLEEKNAFIKRDFQNWLERREKRMQQSEEYYAARRRIMEDWNLSPREQLRQIKELHAQYWGHLQIKRTAELEEFERVMNDPNISANERYRYYKEYVKKQVSKLPPRKKTKDEEELDRIIHDPNIPSYVTFRHFRYFLAKQLGRSIEHRIKEDEEFDRVMNDPNITPLEKSQYIEAYIAKRDKEGWR
jgi:hypothetical protein